jgi:tetratricopeptide (TPR) repeat protein
MRNQGNSVKPDEIQGFPLARVGAFPYNPVDFCILRDVSAGNALASPKGRFDFRRQPGGRKVIIRRRLSGLAIIFAALFLASVSARNAAAQATAAPAGGQANQGTSYTLPEYNALQAAQAEKDPAAQIKLLDAFVAQYPNSTLMQYIYQMYYQAYYKQKNFAKAIEYCDKLIALGDKADAPTRVTAIRARATIFGQDQAELTKGSDAHDQEAKERDAVLLGVKLLPDVKKANPQAPDDQLKQIESMFDGSAGQADVLMKDYPAAVEAFKAQLGVNPNDNVGNSVANYRLGLAYLQMMPPQSLDGFWALARAVDLKIQDADKVKDYLRKTIVNYQQPNCDSLIDAQLNELLQLAANAPERPSTWSIPSAADIQKVAQSSTIITVIGDLSGGGDKAKLTWLAICGAEFPEVIGKIIDVKKNDTNVEIMVFTSASSDEIAAATTANMDVKVWTVAPPAGTPGQITPQPDVTRVQKDDEIRFSGTLVSFDPTPFMLHWDSVKVDPSTIPDKAGTKKPVHKAAAK